jgi:heme exporter protein CcmD
MNFESFGEFLSMRGYARFVWPAYAVALAGLVLNYVAVRRSLKRAQQEQRRRLAVQDSRRSP